MDFYSLHCHFVAVGSTVNVLPNIYSDQKQDREKLTFSNFPRSWESNMIYVKSHNSIIEEKGSEKIVSWFRDTCFCCWEHKRNVWSCKSSRGRRQWESQGSQPCYPWATKWMLDILRKKCTKIENSLICLSFHLFWCSSAMSNIATCLMGSF